MSDDTISNLDVEIDDERVATGASLVGERGFVRQRRRRDGREVAAHA